MPIHVAITRRVRPGCESEFQKALLEFMQASFNHTAVLGANLLVPPPGSDSREFGILRTFAGEAERDGFYDSPLFKNWEERARALTEGEPIYHQLHGLEAWFRASSNSPPRWKMAVATLLGVFPTSLLLGVTVGEVVGDWPFVAQSLAFAISMVALLTWIVMPLITRLIHGWLHSQPQYKRKNQ